MFKVCALLSRVCALLSRVWPSLIQGVFLSYPGCGLILSWVRALLIQGVCPSCLGCTPGLLSRVCALLVQGVPQASYLGCMSFCLACVLLLTRVLTTCTCSFPSTLSFNSDDSAVIFVLLSEYRCNSNNVTHVNTFTIK